MSETVADAANEIENAAIRRGVDAGRAVLARYLDRQGTVSLDFRARLVTELRERDDRRRQKKGATVNIFRV